MAGGGTEVARAYVTIIPKSDGSSDKVVREIVDPLSKGGDDAGAKASKSFSAKFGAGVGGAAKAAGKALVAGIGAATAAAGVFAKTAVDAGRSFDSSMSQVAATMGKSVDEIGELRDFAQEMGAKTAFSASEAADALNYMALAGYDANTSMSMLPNVLNLAAAGGIDLAYASDMITDTQSALGLSLDETTALVDKMAVTSSKTNTSVQQLGEALLTVGGTAKNLKGGTTEAAQALGLLADNGIKGSEGGTALRNVLLGLSSSKFEKTFGALGVSAYDAEGNMRNLKDVFADMNTAMADMTVEEKTTALSSAFNKVDLKSLNALLATDAARWDEVAAAIDDSAGAAQEMADTQLDNLSGDVTIFQSALEGAQIALSDAITPALRDFVQFGTEGLGKLTEAFKGDAFSSFATGFAEDMTRAAEGAYTFLFGVAQQFDENGNLIRERSAGLFEGIFDAIDFEGFAAAFQGLGDAIGAALGDGSKAASAKDVGAAIGGAINVAIPLIQAATPFVAGFAGILKFLADRAAAVGPVLAGLATAFVAMQAAAFVEGFVTTLAAGLGAMGVAGPTAAAGMTAAAAGEAEMGAAAAGASTPLLEMGAAVLMIGAGVAVAAAGVWLLANAAVSLADAGAPAVGIMAGLGVGILALGAGAALAGPALTAGAVGMLAFGGAVLMAGAGIGIAAAGIALLASQLAPMAGSAPAAAAGMAAMGAASVVAGTGLLVVAPGMVAATAAFAAFAPAAGVAAAASGALGAALGLMAGSVLDVGRGAADMGSGLQGAADAMPSIAANAAGAGVGVMTLADAMGRASGNLAAGAVPMKQAGSAAQAMASGVVTAAVGAQTAAALFASFATAVTASMAKASASAAQAASAISRSLASVKDRTVRIDVAAGNVKLPHFSMSGSFDPKTKAVPHVNVSWYATGGLFTRPAVIGVGEGREPEGVFPLSKLESMMEPMGRGNVTVQLNYTHDEGAAQLARDLGRALGRRSLMEA